MASKFGRATTEDGNKKREREKRAHKPSNIHGEQGNCQPACERGGNGGERRWRTHIVAESSHYQRELVERKQYVRAAAQREVGKVHDVDGVDKGVVRRRVVVVDADQVDELADLLLPQHLG